MTELELKAIFLANVDRFLKEIDKSHEWLNAEVFGTGQQGRPRNNLWRPDRKDISLGVAVQVARVLNKSILEMIFDPSKLPPEFSSGLYDEEEPAPRGLTAKYIAVLKDQVATLKQYSEILQNALSRYEMQFDAIKVIFDLSRPPTGVGERRAGCIQVERLLAGLYSAPDLAGQGLGRKATRLTDYDGEA